MDVDDPGGRLLGGRYRLGTLVGQGGAATVYEAVDVVLGRRVAVKLFEAVDPLGRYRFASEARLLAGLSHPGLVTVYDVDLDGDRPFLVLRLVDGPSLRDLLAGGAFEPAAVARIGVRLATVLAYVHAHDVVHRDIKPGNVLVDSSGACHLTDFGLARARSATHLTSPGQYVGTAAYLAPEQITDPDVGPAADIYSLGLLLLECLTGRTEYTGNVAETAVARLSRPPRIPDTLPGSWSAVLTAMTAREPAARPDAARCAALLAAVTDKVTVEVPRPRSVSPRPVHTGLVALALLAVAGAVAAVPQTVPGRPLGEPAAVTPGISGTTDRAPGVRPPAPADQDATGSQRGPGPAVPADVPAGGANSGAANGSDSTPPSGPDANNGQGKGADKGKDGQQGKGNKPR
ncbi:serine/threonine-protein kinase [Actinophytocola algeriensis]|uniref:non-specific serine/threonine protein kinase n=1 Tax=Actinophytocola algeriensis TaxID=1768010 RepID=A0A7W7VI01_9PSEU|nr:serine/threonine-protein kinase [Actinophytocola algeriensis]MBB4911037.1 tRNA A-37 threonylcarbamoyl transferase component Bud32 [Actinophytocola algeriensis]MBE1474030.1 tRNA A-37 threonylcarbamoyl transferase component Bud32 [Actinophytocola algeriensis]